MKLNFQGFNFSAHKFDFKKWQTFYWLLVSTALALFSGASSSLAVSAFLISVKTAENITESFLWGTLVIAPSLIFVHFFIKRGFQQALLISSLTLIPSCFSMVFGRFLPNILNLIGFPFFDSLQALLLIVASLISIIFAFLSITLIIRPSFFLLGTAFIFTGVPAFLAHDKGIWDPWFGVMISTLVTTVGYYIAALALAENEKFLWLKFTSIDLLSLGRKSFRKADLTDADFTQAVLENVDLREAKLLRTSWFKAKGLDCARLGNTYLANPKIRQLVVTCNGQEQNFDGLDLTGVNLRGANLQDASFIGANLNQSSLRDADLSRAVLKQTQLEGADLTGATLTGACIEDWGITSTTKLENVQCEYVFMRVRTKENPNPLRKPDNWQETFAEGEFADFIQPYFDTLDLYHSQDVDPRAISIAFKKLSQNYPEANLEIVAMEKRGQSSFNLKVRTAPTANKSELSSEYFADYNQLKSLSEARLLLLAEKDDRIHSLEQMIQTALHQPTFNVETVQGDFMPENKGISINTGDNANISGVSSGDGIVNLGTISGNVTNAINQLPDSSETGQASLKTLLTQLQEAIETDINLPDPDKSDLLEQVQSLAEAKQTEEPKKREGIARKAMKMFDATLKSLPDTAKIVEACSKLLPLILKALGVPA